MTGGKFIAEFLKMRKENGETASPIVTDFEQLTHFSICLEADEFVSLLTKISSMALKKSV